MHYIVKCTLQHLTYSNWTIKYICAHSKCRVFTPKHYCTPACNRLYRSLLNYTIGLRTLSQLIHCVYSCSSNETFDTSRLENRLWGLVVKYKRLKTRNIDSKIFYSTFSCYQNDQKCTYRTKRGTHSPHVVKDMNEHDCSAMAGAPGQASQPPEFRVYCW